MSKVLINKTSNYWEFTLNRREINQNFQSALWNALGISFAGLQLFSLLTYLSIYYYPVVDQWCTVTDYGDYHNTCQLFPDYIMRMVAVTGTAYNTQYTKP